MTRNRFRTIERKIKTVYKNSPVLRNIFKTKVKSIIPRLGDKNVGTKFK